MVAKYQREMSESQAMLHDEGQHRVKRQVEIQNSRGIRGNW